MGSNSGARRGMKSELLALALALAFALPNASCQGMGSIAQQIFGGGGNPLKHLFGGGGNPFGGQGHIIRLNGPRDPSGGCGDGDDYQDLHPGHLIKADHRGLDCYRATVPAGVALIALEVSDVSGNGRSMLQLTSGRSKHNFPDSGEQHDVDRVLVIRDPGPGEIYFAVNSPMQPILATMGGTIPFTIRAWFVKYLPEGKPPIPGVCSSYQHFADNIPKDASVDVDIHTFDEQFDAFASEKFAIGKPADDDIRSVQQHLSASHDGLVLHLENEEHANRKVIVTVACENKPNEDSPFQIAARRPPFSIWVWVGILCAYWATGAALGGYLAQPERRHRPKSLPKAYALWMTFGLVGAHRFYLNRRTTGLVWLFTAGAGGLGVLLDGFLIPTIVLDNTKMVQYNKVVDEEDVDANIIPMATLASRVMD